MNKELKWVQEMSLHLLTQDSRPLHPVNLTYLPDKETLAMQAQWCRQPQVRFITFLFHVKWKMPTIM